MKTLIIVRHAKSSWADPYLDDYERPLNKRGKNDAPEMGERIKRSGFFPDLMLSSPAKRALKTCEIIAGKLSYPVGEIVTNELLFHASSSEILRVIQQVEDTWTNLMVFGHNPGLTSFVNQLNGVNIDNIPTCGIAKCSLKINSWQDIRFQSGQLEAFDYPKNK